MLIQDAWPWGTQPWERAQKFNKPQTYSTKIVLLRKVTFLYILFSWKYEGRKEGKKRWKMQLFQNIQHKRSLFPSAKLYCINLAWKSEQKKTKPTKQPQKIYFFLLEELTSKFWQKYWNTSIGFCFSILMPSLGKVSEIIFVIIPPTFCNKADRKALTYCLLQHAFSL